jgi:Flp pilus assembly protein TadG
MTMNPRKRTDHGVVALELLLVLPVMLMLIFGTVALGGYLSVKTRTVGLARDGARAAALAQSLPSGTALVGAACPARSDPTFNTTNVTVQATGTYNLQIPFLPGASGSKTLTETVTMRCGG